MPGVKWKLPPSSQQPDADESLKLPFTGTCAQAWVPHTAVVEKTILVNNLCALHYVMYALLKRHTSSASHTHCVVLDQRAHQSSFFFLISESLKSRTRIEILPVGI